MKNSLPLLIFVTVLLSGCQLKVAGNTQTGSPEPKVTAAASTQPSVTIRSVTQTKTAVNRILSDSSEYSPGNPKSHALSPVPFDVSQVRDKTAEGFEQYEPVFQSYLENQYPEYHFRIYSIMNLQKDGKTYKQASACSKESLDVRMTLFYDGDKVTDTFRRDVLERQNTMNRWRREFRTELDRISGGVDSVTRVNLDVSFDYYKDNIPKILLDAPLDMESTSYERCLEMYFQIGLTDPEEVAGIAHAVYQAMAKTAYRFSDYYLYTAGLDGSSSAYRIPTELIAQDTFIPALEKAMTAPETGDPIQRVERPKP